MIDNNKKLADLAEQALQCSVIALDTEFVWERSYYPRLGVVQIALNPEQCYLIDVLALTDFSPLARILESKSVQKILHDAVQDLTILARYTQVTPANIFDTRLAAGFAGLRSTISLQELVNELTGVMLAKTESRTNWLKRPLNPEQVDYARDDVRYLFAVRETELEKIKALGNYAYFSEELEKFDSPEMYKGRPASEQYLRVKGIARLNSRELAKLRELTALREEVAMSRDIPRGWVIADEYLVQLATQTTYLDGEIAWGSGLWAREDKYHNQALLAIQRGEALPANECPTARPWRKDEKSILRKVDALMTSVQSWCLNRGIDPQLIASRSEIKAFIRSNPDESKVELVTKKNFSGWRKELIMEVISQRPC